MRLHKQNRSQTQTSRSQAQRANKRELSFFILGCPYTQPQVTASSLCLLLCERHIQCQNTAEIPFEHKQASGSEAAVTRRLAADGGFREREQKQHIVYGGQSSSALVSCAALQHDLENLC